MIAAEKKLFLGCPLTNIRQSVEGHNNLGGPLRVLGWPQWELEGPLRELGGLQRKLGTNGNDVLQVMGEFPCILYCIRQSIRPCPLRPS